MKFKFTKNLDYQLEAIDAIVRIFDSGQNTSRAGDSFQFHHVSPVVANELEVDEPRLLQNIQSIQNQHEIEQSTTLGSMDFSIEMETGTGKTYVYLRTALELNRVYGLKKFIVLVPSVAIREGVFKTIEQTKEHFQELYGVNIGAGSFAYDSSKLSRVREFAQSVDVQIMIMTIQSFNSDDRVMRQTPDRFNGESPLGLVSAARPVVIMDEPQNMESELSKAAIADLKPLFKLRYSATHKEKHNLMYQLTPVDAYRQGLVKKIEVFGVNEDDSGAFVFKVKEIRTRKNKAPEAKVGVDVMDTHGDFDLADITVKAGDDLYRKTKHEAYRNLLVNEIDARRNIVELSNGVIYKLEESVGENKEAIFRTQIHETIKAHMKKQEELGQRAKVLSLFFVDKVDNYMAPAGIIRTIFTEEFERIKMQFEFFKRKDVVQAHNGYFANKKTKDGVEYKDTTGKTLADKEVYDIIMKDKERLLSFDEQICFVFSHSALKEGWDNPNVFQICTLNETTSQSKKRQEIGRGLRLAVDTNGDRIFDSNVNILTVVANESYRDFVGRLQAEYADAGYAHVPEASNARRKVTVKFRKHLSEQSIEFKELWEKIRKKTAFNIEIVTKTLIQGAVKKISELNIRTLAVRVEKVVVDFGDNNKIKTIYENESVGERIAANIRIENIIARMIRETGVTKQTVFEILSQVFNLDLLFQNPEEYIRSAIVIIKSQLNELLINEGLQYIPTGDVWEISLFEDIVWYKNKTAVSEKSMYDHVIFDSEGEREFAENLETSARVKLFTKLPPSFVVDTPLGTYNPDWAIVVATENGDKLYLVRETKFVNDLENLRPSEKQKIICGEKHFASIGVDFKVSKELDLSDLI